MGIFNKVKERERKLFPETPGKHPGNTRETPGNHPGITRETPGKGAFTNILHKRSRFRKKKNFFSNTHGDFEQRKREK